MKSNWFLYGPFTFEASAVAGSARAALGHLVEQYQSQERWSRLHLPSRQPEQPGRSDGRAPGIYLILRAEEGVEPPPTRRGQEVELLRGKPLLAGFWVVFGHTYLGEGVVGPPDKEPPYVQGVLDACTEEVWWKNLEVYPRTEGTWKPCMLFEWPSDLASRSTLAPPGVPLSPSEIADPDAEDKFGGDWLEQLDEEVVREERRRAEALRRDSPWLELPAQRSLLMLTQGFLQKKRVSHEGSFRMVHPEWLGTGGEAEILEFDVWMERIYGELAPERTEQERHALGQPLALPGGRVGFPASGWLTRNLTIWPASPIDIRKGKLSPRDIGSKLVAQLRQASVVTALVLLLLVGLSWIIFLLTKPRLVAVQEPPPVVPEPAMSVCSADHAKFMDEFRCQVESFVYGAGTDQPVCGDKGSKELLKPTGFDLQAEYCGLRDRELDGWIWPRDAGEDDVKYNFGHVAASKACFNVLGHPYNYKLPADFSDATSAELPNPDLFLAHPDLSIKGLGVLVDQLEVACDTYQERMAYQVEGAAFATHIGTRPADETRVAFDNQQEGAKLRLRLRDKAMSGVKADLRQCFQAGMDDGAFSPRRLAELCGFLPWSEDEPAALAALGAEPPTAASRGEESRRMRNATHDARKVWQELYGEGVARSVQTVTGEIAQLFSAIDRYNYARFGNPLLPTRGNRSESLWQCHGDLTADPSGQLNTKFVSTMWDLSVPVPGAYRIEGAGVKTQISLDAALRSFSEGGSSAQDAGACWRVISRRLSKYQPVHPLLAELDPAGWPSVEQQLCGQVCATRYRVASSAMAEEWVTPGRDLTMCITTDSPVSRSVQGHIRRIAAIRPSDSDAEKRFADARRDLVRATDPKASGSTFRPFTGGGFDTLRVPWHQRSERVLERVSRDYSSAVLQRNAEMCDRIQLDDAIYFPVEINDRGTTADVCRENYGRLSSGGRELCDRYQELLPRYAQLRDECKLAVAVNWGQNAERNELERYLEARILVGEGWLDPSRDQICAFNLIAQGYMRDADDTFLLGGLAPPLWAGQTALGSRIAGGGLGAKEAAGVSYEAANSLSRFGRTRSRNTCSYAASQCFTEKFMEVTGNPGNKPFDWDEEWSRLLLQDIYQTDQRGANRLKQRSPWCALIQPYVNLEPGDIDYPCAIGVDEARKSVSRTIDYLAEKVGTEG